MKTRIVYPKLWNDVKFAETNISTKLLFMYLITNEALGLSRYTRISDRQIMFDTGLNSTQLQAGKEELTQLRWCFFSGEWVYHNHDCAYVEYEGNQKVTTSKLQEIEKVPAKIQEVINGFLTPQNDTEVSSNFKGLETGYQPNINYKSKTINQKLKKEGGAGETFLQVWNETHETNFKSPKQLQGNLEFWLTVYSLEDILKAIPVLKVHDYWKSRNMTPEVFLRRKNPAGEPVDRIGEMLNYKPKQTFQAENQDKYKNL